MASRSIVSCLLLTLALAGCAHRQPPPMADNAVPQGSVAEVSPPPPVAEPAATIAVTQASYGERHHIPAQLKGPQAVADTDPPYLLDSGDRLRIFVYGQPNLSRIYVVDHAGQIGVPLIGTVKARGLTTSELGGRIRGRLATQYVKDPQITVDINQHRPFFILGEVRTAGQYPYVNGMTVQSAVAVAGGYSERANERKVQITRRINGFIEKMIVPPDYIVQAGDTVYVYERYF